MIQKIKHLVKNIESLALSIDSYCKITQTDASSIQCAGILLLKPTKGNPKEQEEITIYSSVKFTEVENKVHN